MLWFISVTTFYDPRKSRIEKNFFKFGPKFLNLYVSTLGNITKTARAIDNGHWHYYSYRQKSNQY